MSLKDQTGVLLLLASRKKEPDLERRVLDAGCDPATHQLWDQDKL